MLDHYPQFWLDFFLFIICTNIPEIYLNFSLKVYTLDMDNVQKPWQDVEILKIQQKWQENEPPLYYTDKKNCGGQKYIFISIKVDCSHCLN